MRQHRLMEAVAHNADFARKVSIPQSVGLDYATADKSQNLKKLPDKAKSKRA